MEQSRSGSQQTWRLLNRLIKKGSKNKTHPEHFRTDEDIVLHKIKDTANELNDFFGHVGFNVAQEIQELRNNNELNKHITEFVVAVSQRNT